MKSAKRGSKRDQTQRRMTHDGMTRTNTLSQCRVRDCNTCAQTRENVTCEGVLLTPWIGAVPRGIALKLLCLLSCNLHPPSQVSAAPRGIAIKCRLVR